MRGRALLLALLLALAAPGGTGCGPLPPAAGSAAAQAPAAASPGFETVWPLFRQALLAEDAQALAAMTRFPLDLRGELDSGPPRRAAPSDLPAVIGRALRADTGLSLRATLTNQALVERLGTTLQPQRGVSLGPDTARVGAFAFMHTPDAGWRLWRVYLPD